MLENPIILAALICFFLGLALSCLARVVPGPTFASVVLPIVFLASYVLTYQQVPDFPPIGATNKIFYIALAAEKEPVRVLKTIRRCMKPEQRIFVGVVAPIDPHVDTPEEVLDRVLEAAKYIPLEQLGTTDDCGFSPFSDDTSTPREVAFAKIRARVLGTEMATEILGRN